MNPVDRPPPSPQGTRPEDTSNVLWWSNPQRLSFPEVPQPPPATPGDGHTTVTPHQTHATPPPLPMATIPEPEARRTVHRHHEPTARLLQPPPQSRPHPMSRCSRQRLKARSAEDSRPARVVLPEEHHPEMHRDWHLKSHGQTTKARVIPPPAPESPDSRFAQAPGAGPPDPWPPSNNPAAFPGPTDDPAPEYLQHGYRHKPQPSETPPLINLPPACVEDAPAHVCRVETATEPRHGSHSIASV